MKDNQLFAAQFHVRKIVQAVPTDFEAIVNLAAVEARMGGEVR